MIHLGPEYGNYAGQMTNEYMHKKKHRHNFFKFIFVTKGFLLVLFCFTQFLNSVLFTGLDILALRHHFAIHQSLSECHHFGLDCLRINGIL